MNIQKISQRIFGSNVVSKESTKANLYQSNPFAPNVKLNMLSADIFQPKAVKLNNLALNVSEKLNSGVSSVISFGRKIKDSVSNAWETAKNINIEINVPNVKNMIQDRIAKHNEYKVENLVKRPVSDLKDMMKAQLVA